MADVELEVTLEERQVLTALNKLTRASQDFGNNAGKGFKKASTAFQTFAGVLTANVVSSAISGLANTFSLAVDSIISNTIELETIETQFQSLTGSVENASKVVKELQQFTASTPFQFPGVAQAAQKLLAFGFQAENLIPILTKIGDVAAGSGNDLNSIATIFGQVSAAGKLTGERLLQFQERGIPIFAQLEAATGKTGAALTKFISQGGVDFKTFEKAFSSLSAAGGPFFEATIRQSKTLGGVLSTLKDNFAIVASDIGSQFLPALKGFAVAIIDLVQKNRALIASFAGNVFRFFIGGISAAIDGVNFFQRAIAGVEIFLNGLENAFLAFQFTINEWIVTLLKAAKAAKEVFGGDTSGIDDQISALEQENVALEENAAANTKSTNESLVNTQKRIAVTKQFQKELENLRKEQSKPPEKQPEQEGAGKPKGAALAKQDADKELDIKRDKNEKEVELEVERIEILATLREDEKLAKQEAALEDKLAKDEATEADLIKLEETLAARKAIEARFQKENLETFKKARKAKEDQRKKDEKATKKQNESLVNLDRANNQSRADNFKSTLGTIATLQKSGNKNLFKIGQASAIANASISIAEGIASALKLGPILGPPLGALVAIAGAVQINAIRSQSPGFQGGGIIPGAASLTDNTLINAAGGELVLNRRQQTDLFNSINQNNIGSQPNQVTVQIDGNVIGNDEFTQEIITGIRDAIEFDNAVGI